jgi:hypothetical protein
VAVGEELAVVAECGQDVALEVLPGHRSKTARSNTKNPALMRGLGSSNVCG